MRFRRWSPQQASEGRLQEKASSAGSSPASSSGGGGHSNSSTVPIAELVREAPTATILADRCVYFSPPGAAKNMLRTLPVGQQKSAGLRRFLFFGDSPRPAAAEPSGFGGAQQQQRPWGRFALDEAGQQCSPVTALRTGRSGKANQLGPPKSHSSRTVSLDFDSESTGTTIPAEETIINSHQKCNGSGQQQQKALNVKQTSNGTPFRHPQQRHSQQQMLDSSPSFDHSARPSRRPAGPSMQFGGGSQFDTQSLQARRSRSFAAHHQQMASYPSNGEAGGDGTPRSMGGYQQQQQQSHEQPPMRCGSCSNLSLAGAGGQLVLYEGTPLGHHHQQQQHELSRRHSMIVPMDAAAAAANMAAAPVWYQPMMPPPAPPPPFYYTASTLPHLATIPGAPMDYSAFKRAMKESERFDKKQRKMMFAEMDNDNFGSACCEFCCGGSALILWLVVSLVALGFLGFLLLAIYFV